MTVIDIDSHYLEPFEWLEGADPALAAEVPKVDTMTMILDTAFGEVLSTLPPWAKPSYESRIPKMLLPADGVLSPEYLAQASVMLEGLIRSVPGGHNVEERLAFLDAQGIDQQWLLPTFAFTPISYFRREKPDLVGRALVTYNTWATDHLAGTDRLLPVVVVDLKSMTRPEVIAELTRCRGLGARSFVFWPGPVEDKSIAHPDFEWFWAAAEDLGLMPMMHVGAGRPTFDTGWLNNGREFPSQLLAFLGQLHQPAELVLSELLAAGVFERHPRLRLLIAELGVDWLPSFISRIDRLATGQVAPGAWTHPMLPSEYLRRNVRVTPLQMDPVGPVIDELGKDIIVFSSDYPHPEGGVNAVAGFRAQLTKQHVAPDVIEAFFGDTIAADLALTA